MTGKTHAFGLTDASACRHRDGAAVSTSDRGVLLELARGLEPDVNRLAEWWHGTGIAELGGWTPDQLAKRGQGDALERFLRSIICGDRD